MNVDRLVEQARELRPAATGEAAYQFLSESPGLLAGLADAVERLHTWDGLMSLLDEHYPSDVFVGGAESDPGPRIVGLVRELDAARARVAALEAALRPLVTQLDDWYSKCRDEEQVYTAPAGEHWGMDTAIQEGGWKPAYALGDVRAAAALLDGRVPSTGQETT